VASGALDATIRQRLITAAGRTMEAALLKVLPAMTRLHQPCRARYTSIPICKSSTPAD